MTDLVEEIAAAVEGSTSEGCTCPICCERIARAVLARLDALGLVVAPNSATDEQLAAAMIADSKRLPRG